VQFPAAVSTQFHSNKGEEAGRHLLQVRRKNIDRAKYDLNTNGLSKDEISNVSLTGQRAVELARALS
jgi:hypothetical protein